MPQSNGTPTGPSASEVVARRVKELRKRHGWTAADLAARCADMGMETLNRSVLANVESGRRKYVTIDEVLVLAHVLDVAPLHLFVPTSDAPDDRYTVSPEAWVPTVREARAWVRGEYAGPTDPRVYFSEVPRDEWEPQPLSEERIEELGERHAASRHITEQLFPPGSQAEALRAREERD